MTIKGEERKGYGKHEWRHIDRDTFVMPDIHTSSVERKRRTLALNEKSPEVKARLEDFFDVGGEFETDLVGYEGRWKILRLPVVGEDGNAGTVVVQGDRNETISLVLLGVLPDIGTHEYISGVKTVYFTRSKVIYANKRI